MKNLITTIMVIVLVCSFATQVMAQSSLPDDSSRVTAFELTDDSCQLMAYDPLPLVTWIIGFISTRPQTYNTSRGSIDVLMDLPVALKEKYGYIAEDNLYLKPYSGEGEGKQLMTSQGAAYRTFTKKDGCVTSTNFFWPHDKNGIIELGGWRLYHVSEQKDATQTEGEIIREGNFKGNNLCLSFSFEDSKHPYRLIAYPLNPKNLKDSAISVTYYARPMDFYAREISFEQNGRLGQMLFDAEDQRQRESYSTKRTADFTINIAGTQSPVSLVVVDQFGEVFRGTAINAQPLKLRVAPGTIGVMRGEDEVELTSSPSMPRGLVQAAEGQDNQICVYPVANAPATARCKNFSGIIKIPAAVGTTVQLSGYRDGQKVFDAPIPVKKFYGAEVKLVEAMRNITEIRANVNGVQFSKKVESEQVALDCDSPKRMLSYSLHGADKVVECGVNTLSEASNFGSQSQLFLQKCRELEVPESAISRIRNKFAASKIKYVMAGPTEKWVNDNGSKMKTVTRIKGLTSGHGQTKKEYYYINFKEFVRVWVPEGEYGWTVGIDSYCGNVYLVWITPPTITVVVTPPLPPAPPPKDVPRISLSWLYIGSDKSGKSSTINNPTAPPPYIPAADFNLNIENGNNIANSQSQGQNQHQDQHQGQNQVSDNYNSNSNPVTVSPTFNINNANNNLNQFQNGTNVLIPISFNG